MGPGEAPNEKKSSSLGGGGVEEAGMSELWLATIAISSPETLVQLGLLATTWTGLMTISWQLHRLGYAVRDLVLPA